jgi:hypothetical protein
MRAKLENKTKQNNIKFDEIMKLKTTKF